MKSSLRPGQPRYHETVGPRNSGLSTTPTSTHNTTAIMATSGLAGSGEPDMALISELLEDIARHPPAIAARKLLAEHYLAIGWIDAASDNIKEMKKADPKDPDVIKLAKLVGKKSEPPIEESGSQNNAVNTRFTIPVTQTSPTPGATKPMRPVPQLHGDLDTAKKDFIERYQAMHSRARFLLTDLLHLRNLQKKNGLPQSKNTVRVQAIVEGCKSDTSVPSGCPGSARAVGRTIQANPSKALDVAIGDLEDTMHWTRSPHGRPSGANDDTVRDILVKRAHSLQFSLPENLKIYCELALMHVTHENLEKNYANTETMLGDLVKEIPREQFYTTEDNYAWDMSELVQAISVNGGVMRNPLSKQMFTPRDIRGILLHSTGKPLAALQIEQNELSKGVRPDTITKMEELAKVLLDDQSSDALPSRHKVDEFLAYTATLPEEEQKAIDGFRAPAKDSHTGDSYNFSIGEAVRDAKGNRVCFHKTGDFIQQAAAYLRQNRGAPPDSNKCIAM